jgi:serine/threonine protein kinase
VEPATFGKYLLCERIAEGGMAVVWRAKLIGPGGFEKEFCVKQIRTELAERREFIDLFVAEAKLTVSLTHSNIVPVYELGMVDGTYFLALELIDGPTLAQIVKQGRLPPALAGYVVEQVLRGLDYAHRRGVVHRDLSPANVLVSRDGEVKIVDFGISSRGGSRVVQGGSRGYMAPEQEKGGDADARSDLYAVGVLLWELCAGRKYDGNSADAPEALESVIKRATDHDPEARFPDAASMLGQVSRYLRDLSMGPTQLELSEHVRKRFPAVVSGSAKTTALRGTGPHTVPVEGRRAQNGTGPHTAAVPGRTGKQVTFATRIEVEALAEPRSRWLRLAAAVAVVAALGGGVAWWRASATPVTADPTPNPAPNPAPNPTPPVPNPPAAPATGHLTLTTVPPGAEARAGDRLLGTTPLEADLPLDAAVVLHLRKRGFAPVDKPLEPSAFAGTPRAATVSERLTPLGKGELTLNALPWAHVTIDGEKRPDTPLIKLALTAGPHQVKLVCPPTGRELRFTVVVEADKEVKRLADLRGEPKLVDAH